ncbi:AraC-like DNA-binding protein [Bradyrhizobium sp. S3.12.5]|uniref:AraC family transcriptional regulator n=1 Tax=Bradyrhizobium sp. S3.12.5 TaxID=3156386 RepID=UPI003398AAEB
MKQKTEALAAADYVDDVGWLSMAREVRHPLSHTSPLWVKEIKIESGTILPAPPMQQPEWHPFCEFSYIFSGGLVQYVGPEKMEKRAGDIMLLGTGTPHYAVQLSYPLRWVTIFFLPSLFFELGPEQDGAHAMTRFLGNRRLTDCVVRPPADIGGRLANRFEQMAAEAAQPGLGSELRLRALFMENIVDILRWEQGTGRAPEPRSPHISWLQLGKALRYIHEHYATSMYVADVARSAGLSVGSLQEVFKNALGLSCIQYLRNYRISRAAALLRSTDDQITQIALDVGFESLGHFNTSFRDFLGCSPTSYRAAHQNR